MKVALLGIALVVVGISGGTALAYLVPPASAVAPASVAASMTPVPPITVDCDNPFIAAAKPDGWACEG